MDELSFFQKQEKAVCTKCGQNNLSAQLELWKTLLDVMPTEGFQYLINKKIKELELQLRLNLILEGRNEIEFDIANVGKSTTLLILRNGIEYKIKRSQKNSIMQDAVTYAYTTNKKMKDFCKSDFEYLANRNDTDYKTVSSTLTRIKNTGLSDEEKDYFRALTANLGHNEDAKTYFPCIFA